MSKRLFLGADKLLFARAAELRSQPTHAENVLWGYLRTKPLGFKFRRQHPFAIYILDFYCYKLQLVIEVDGKIHEDEEVKRHDEEREAHLKSAGLTILRFTNDANKLNLQKVIQTIEHYLLKNKLQ